MTAPTTLDPREERIFRKRVVFNAVALATGWSPPGSSETERARRLIAARQADRDVRDSRLADDALFDGHWLTPERDGSDPDNPFVVDGRKLVNRPGSPADQTIVDRLVLLCPSPVEIYADRTGCTARQAGVGQVRAYQLHDALLELFLLANKIDEGSDVMREAGRLARESFERARSLDEGA